MLLWSERCRWGILLVVGVILCLHEVYGQGAPATTRPSLPPAPLPTTPHLQPCTVREWRCWSGECVPKTWLCNGMNNCEDASDENGTMCSRLPCDDGQFDCEAARAKGKRECISLSAVCDKTKDCTEGEDEDDCDCDEDEFMCKPRECIPKEFECDRIADCKNKADEHSNCTYPVCGNDTFVCKAKQHCLPIEVKCDGKRDCGDGSDETTQLCAKKPGCPDHQIRCRDGKCIQAYFACNQHDDCNDGDPAKNLTSSDESGCGVMECQNNPCTHQCVETTNSFFCRCPPGYRLQEDKVTCLEINECTEFPRKCSQLCKNTDGGFSCSCAKNYKLDTDNATCRSQDKFQPFLIFANRFYIRRMDLDGGNYKILTDENEHSHVLDYDYIENTIYFADARLRTIAKMLSDGTNVTVIKALQEQSTLVEGIAIDWVNSKIYWTDSRLTAVFVSEKNGTNIKALYKKSPHPRGIVVDPSEGYLYWTDWGAQAFIGKMGMDGSQLVKIITKSIFWPNAISIDYVAKRLWWADAYFDVIESADLDGKNRQVIMSNMPHIYAISIYEEWMIWVDWNVKTIERANRFTGANHTKLQTLQLQPYDIHVYHPSLQPKVPNPCGAHNGGCSHLCLLAPGAGQFSCACPEHFILTSNNKTCNANCSAAQFDCGAGDSRCVPHYWVCDGEEDCKNGRDEKQNCPERTCDPGLFQCKNDECISYSKVCDGSMDCTDNSDENGTQTSGMTCANRTCLPYQFKCKTGGQCIQASWKCDGDDDCHDGSDEDKVMCDKPVSCAESEFTCGNKKCIPKHWKCDYDDDCGDASDEPREYCWGRGCMLGWWRCNSTYRCVPKLVLCDGEDDCRDNSDEHIDNCEDCPVGDFQCANKRCIPLRWKCDFENDCGDNSDESDTLCKGTGHRKNCTEVEFRCKNEKCIHKRYRCDTNNDCGDRSDEQDCLAHVCPEERFKCKNGPCIPEQFRCDGLSQCTDQSDERECPEQPGGCNQHQFQCHNSKHCVPKVWACDTGADCPDGSDEIESVCKNHTCLSSNQNFKCDQYKCLPRSKVCDGEKNCVDGTDENNHALCNPTPICHPSQDFRCENKKCIPKALLCDQSDDCGDKSDEIGCNKKANCTINKGGCQQFCTTVPSGAVCSCMAGFTINPNNKLMCADVDECAAWGNKCPQRCINTKAGFNQTYGYICLCAPGFKSQHNGNQHWICRPTKRDDRVYFFSILGTVRQFWPHKNSYGDVVRGGTEIMSLDVDTRRGMMYWADRKKKQIFRAKLPDQPGNVALPQNLEVKDKGALTEPDGIAFDWVTGNVYIADPGSYSVFVVTENGTSFKTLLIPSLDRKPKSIAVSPELGMMFWTDIASLKIERAWMDGTHAEVIVNTDLGNPVGIAVDHYMNNRLYWTDAKYNTIQSSRPDGTDRVTVIHTGTSSPYRLDVMGLDLLWTTTDGEVLVQDKFGRGVNVTMSGGKLNTQVEGIKAYQSQERYDLNITNRCSGLGCSTMCLLVPGGGVCVCPDDANFKKGSKTECDIQKETPKKPPIVCHCENGGSCNYINNTMDKPECICRRGFTGINCGNKIQRPTTRRPDNISRGALVAAILIPILILVIMIILIALFVLWRMEKFPFGKGQKGKFRAGPAGMHGTARIVDNEVLPESVYNESGQPPSVHYNVVDGETRIGNPLYEQMYENESVGLGQDKVVLDSQNNEKGAVAYEKAV